MIALAVLGLSLSLKHVLIYFPVWLAMRRDVDALHRLLCLLIPYGIFGLSFLPYASEGQDIWQHVVQYRSFNNGQFWFTFAFGSAIHLVPLIWLFTGAMLVAGWWTRHESVQNQLFTYLCCVLIFSSAQANQYLAIPLAALAARWNRWALGYTAVATLFLCANYEGLNLPQLQYYWNTGNGSGEAYLRCLLLLLMLHVVSLPNARCPAVTDQSNMIQASPPDLPSTHSN